MYLKADNNKSIINRGIGTDEILKIPVAHAEGRYFVPKEMLQSLNDNQQVIYRYCNKDGEVTQDANPNGAIDNIAGVCNENRNVFGMMPHPERAADLELGNTDGLRIFESMLDLVKA